MRHTNRWFAGVMAVAIGLFVLGFPPTASANFVLSLQEDGGAITEVANVASFSPVTASGIFGDFTYQFFNATAVNSATGSNLLSSTNTVSIGALSTETHTLSMFVSNQDYTLPVGPELLVRSGMGGTYGAEPGFIAGADFRMWADAANGLNTIPGTFSNGLQVANPASGNATTFSTGGDPAGIFTRIAGDPFSLTSRVRITTTGAGDMNYSTHILVSRVPEPGLLLIGLMGAGLLGLFIGARRKS